MDGSVVCDGAAKANLLNQFFSSVFTDEDTEHIPDLVTGYAGPGIDEDIEKFMFYPFITSKVNSEGLGLTYVNSVVSKYGGYFKYEREKGRSTLNMFLPLVKNRSVNY